MTRPSVIESDLNALAVPEIRNLVAWQRVRESNPCTSLERAYACVGVQLAVATLLLLFEGLPTA